MQGSSIGLDPPAQLHTLICQQHYAVLLWAGTNMKDTLQLSSDRIIDYKTMLELSMKISL